MNDTIAPDTILVATPKPLEWEAWLPRLENAVESLSESTLLGTIGSARVVVALTGKGQTATAAALTRLLRKWQPRYLLLVGIAGGLAKAKKGDVVISSFVYSFDFGKIEGDRLRLRPEPNWAPDKRLLDVATMLAEETSARWKRRIRVDRPTTKARRVGVTMAHVGYCGSSDKVIDDTEYRMVTDALRTSPEVLAVEMEAIGANAAVREVLSTGQADHPMGLLMVRGISDEPAGSERRPGIGRADRGQWTRFAADVAAAFSEELIRALYPQETAHAIAASPAAEATSSGADPLRSNALREEMLAILDEQAALLALLHPAEVDWPSPHDMLAAARSRLQSNTLRIAVLARFSSGKSALLNALIGEHLLPLSYGVTTGQRCEIKHPKDGRRQAVLFRRVSTPETRIEVLPLEDASLLAEVRRRLSMSSGEASAPSQIYDGVELFWPSNLGRLGAEFVDAPGVDSPDLPSDPAAPGTIALSADLVIYCMKATENLSAVDRTFLDRLGAGQRSIIFAITHADLLPLSIEASELTSIREFLRTTLLPRTDLQAGGIIYLDSRGALRAKGTDDDAELQASGLAELESRLTSHLRADRGSRKVLSAITAMRFASRSSREQLELERRALARPMELQLAAEAGDRLRSIATSSAQVLETFQVAAFQAGQAAQVAVADYLTGLADRAAIWTQEAHLDALPFPALSTHIQTALRRVYDQASEKVQEDVTAWTRTTLMPSIAAGLEQDAALQDSIRQYASQLALLRHPATQALQGLMESIIAQAGSSVEPETILGAASPLTTLADRIAAQVSIHLVSGIVVGTAIFFAAPLAFLSMHRKGREDRLKTIAAGQISAHVISKRDAISAEIKGIVTRSLDHAMPTIQRFLGEMGTEIRMSILNAGRAAQEAGERLEELARFEERQARIELHVSQIERRLTEQP